MISFKDITPEDREEVASYTLLCPQRNCDLSFSNLCSWRFLYDTKFAVRDGFLLLKFWVEGRLSYMMPIGSGDLRGAVDALTEDARREGEPLRLSGVCQEMCSELEAVMPARFHFTADRDYADYIYLRTELATLAGKKLQAKRNHVNKFRRTYNYDYLPLTADRIRECEHLLESLSPSPSPLGRGRDDTLSISNSPLPTGEGAGERLESLLGLSNERRALLYALHHFDRLGLTGGILHVDGKIAAFTFGMPINQDTFGVHVEKADTRIDGAYAMINYEFARHVPEQYVYLNREEDLGIEGLRKAKLSYQPVMVLEKFVATLRE